MASHKKSQQSTTAFSLAAITAGAVAAALLVMGIGLLVTAISIGSDMHSGMQTVSGVHQNPVIVADNGTLKKLHRVSKKATKDHNYFIDALYRDDGASAANAASEQPSAARATLPKMHHVFA